MLHLHRACMVSSDYFLKCLQFSSWLRTSKVQRLLLVVGELTPLVARFRYTFSEGRIGFYMTQLPAAQSNSVWQSFQKAFRSHILFGLNFSFLLLLCYYLTLLNHSSFFYGFLFQQVNRAQYCILFFTKTKSLGNSGRSREWYRVSK